MRRAVDRLFRMDQEKREEIYEAVKHDMEFMDKKAWEKGKFNLESDQLPEAAQKILRDFFGYFYDVVLCTTHFRLEGMSRIFLQQERAGKGLF